MVSKMVLVALCLVVAVAAVPPGFGPAGFGPAGAAGGVNPWMPPWLSNAPWMPQWSGPCAPIGTSCSDCNTRTVCTKVGGLPRPCNDPTLPYCNAGECSATPSAECATQAAAVPATAV